MADLDPLTPCCPRCGSTKLTLCGQSVDYLPEDYPGQPLPDRAVQTLAYQCECGLAFTKSVKPTDPSAS